MYRQFMIFYYVFIIISCIFNMYIYTLSRMALGRVILSYPTGIADSFIQILFLLLPFIVLSINFIPWCDIEVWLLRFGVESSSMGL